MACAQRTWCAKLSMILNVSIYVLGVLAGYTWRDGRNEKHIEPLFEELVNIPELPSPIVFLSLDLQHGYLLPKFAGI